MWGEAWAATGPWFGRSTEMGASRVVTTLGDVDVVRHAATEVMGLRVVTTTLGK